MAPAASPSYLDLGGALAACGLIFAAYQLRRPEWDVVLSIRDRWQRSLFLVLGLAGLLTMLARVAVGELLSCRLSPPFDAPALYEVTAYLLFIASPGALIYFAIQRRKLFTDRTAERFYGVMVKEIAQSSPERLNAALEVLMSNLDDICKYAHDDPLNRQRGGYARAVLDVILSDDSVVRLVTTKRLDMLVHIFLLVEKHKLTRTHSRTGIPGLVANLYSDSESFLYKQLDYTGLALSVNTYDVIFGSPVILSGFNLFEYPAVHFGMRAHSGPEGVKVFIECLTGSIKTYLETGRVPPRNINAGLSHLSDVFENACLKISSEARRDVDTKHALPSEWNIVNQIARFLGHDYLFIGVKNQLDEGVARREATASEGKFSSEATINDGVAAALYASFEHLAYCDRPVRIYDTVVSLLSGMLFRDALREGYRRPFQHRVWAKIAQNVKERYYPAVLRVYLTFFAHRLAGQHYAQAAWVEEETERLRRLLYIDLKPLLDRNEKMANEDPMKEELLPESMDYADGQYFYMSGGRREAKTAIPPPPGDATSALEGVAMDDGAL